MSEEDNGEEVYEDEEEIFDEKEETIQWTDPTIPEPGEEIVEDGEGELRILDEPPADIPRELIRLGTKIKNATNKRRQKERK